MSVVVIFDNPQGQGGWPPMGGYVSTNYKQEEELMTSVCDGDVEAVEELLERGVDVNLQDDELSCPIHVAAYLGRDTVIRVLLDHGAALEARGQLDVPPRTEGRSTI